jgi:SAM-dependent methyltransferase
MTSLYEEDLAYVQAHAFGDFARAAAPYIVQRLREAAVPVRRVVDVGCGAGVTTRALVDAGFDTVAIERSAPLLAFARAAAPAASFVHASAYEVELPACHAILAVGEPLTYHAPGDDADAVLRAFFARCAGALSPGGLVAFDLIVTGEPSLDGAGFRSADDWAILYRTEEERPSRRLVRTIETFRRTGDLYRRAREVHHVRVFPEATVRGWLEDLGFQVVTARAYGDAALATRRVAFLAARS